jgi:O-antigen/teichoic acid export membrane protein
MCDIILFIFTRSFEKWFFSFFFYFIENLNDFVYHQDNTTVGYYVLLKMTSLYNYVYPIFQINFKF